MEKIKTEVLSFLFKLLAFLALLHQYFFTTVRALWQPYQIRHHETLSLALMGLACSIRSGDSIGLLDSFAWLPICAGIYLDAPRLQFASLGIFALTLAIQAGKIVRIKLTGSFKK